MPEWAARDPRVLALLQEREYPAPAFEQYGIEKFQAGDAALAAKAFAAAAALQPRHAIYHNNHGVALHALGDHTTAVEAFRASLAIDKDQPQIWLNMAHALNAMDKTDEAEQAFINAAGAPETSVEALTALGRLCLDRAEYAEAAEFLQHAVESGGGNAALHATLGAALFQMGRPAEAAAIYATAAAMDPKQTGYKDNADFLVMLDGVLHNVATSAVEAYAAPLTEDRMLVSAFSRALTFLTTFGHVDAATRLIEEWLQYYPDNAEALFLKDIIDGKVLVQAPSDYIATHFDQLAGQLDARFLRSLDYHVPEDMREMFSATAGEDWTGDILDLGCGSGLAGRALKSFASKLTGVDLSPGMIDLARATGIYDQLVTGEMIECMTGNPDGFDLIVAADSLNYSGALEPVFDIARQALHKRGWFMLSLETDPDLGSEEYRLMISGRFRHNPAYVQRVGASREFRMVGEMNAVLRKHAGHPVEGTIFLFQRTAPLTARL